MATPSIPDAKVFDAVSSILQKNCADPLAASYAEICSEANRLAIADINRILVTKGYSPAVIAVWDDLGRYNLDQAIFWALTRAGGLSGLSDSFVKNFDRRKELETMTAIIVGGVPQPAGGTQVGGISSGRNTTFDHLNHRHRRW